MDASDSYLVVERIIHEGDIPLLEVERLLETLEDQQLITVEEHESLLGLARKMSASDVSTGAQPNHR